MSFTPPVGSATTSTKGIVKLAGDLSGTADLPTVVDGAITEPKLAASNSPSASQVLTWDGSNLGWQTPSSGVDDGTRLLDSFSGSTDDDKLTAAITWQQATAGMPAIRLAARSHTFNQTRPLYSGLKLVGTVAGPKNLEQSSGAFVPTSITLGSSISSGASSWWVTPGGNLFDIYMADFAVQGSQGSSVHQFIDVTTGSLYACQFHALSFNFMRGVFGRKDRKCLMTQVIFSGHWTANNLWDTQFNIGGSDCQLWVGGYINMGPSSSPVQLGTYADGDYQIIFDSLGKTNVGYIYISALNGWRGLKISGNSGPGLQFFGGVYEGYKATGTTSGGATLAAPGTVIRIEGGNGTFYSPAIGQGMADPDVAEGGLVHMTAGEWTFVSPSFHKGAMAETTPCIYQTGGRLLVTGASRQQSETWTSRPGYSTTAGGPNSTSTSFYCPDMSMVSV